MAVTCFPQVTAMLVELNPQLFLRGVDDYGRTIWKARNFPKIPRCSGRTTALRDLHYAYQHTYHGLFVSRYTIFMAIFATQLGFRILYDGTGQKDRKSVV